MKKIVSIMILAWASTVNLSHATPEKEDNESIFPPIVRHVMTGDAAEVIRYHEKGGDINLKLAAGDNEIPLTLFARDLTMTRLMFHLGADLKEKTKDNHTILMSAVRMGDFDLSRFLVEQGLSIDDTDDHGNHLIHYAIGNSQSRILDWLLEKGANPNAINNDGETPLMESLLHYDLDEIRKLLEYGADVTMKDNEGRSVLHYLEKRKEYQERHLYLAARHLIQDQIINQFLEGGSRLRNNRYSRRVIDLHRNF